MLFWSSEWITAWLLMSTVPCYMEAYFYTQQTRRAQTENSGIPKLTIFFLVYLDSRTVVQELIKMQVVNLVLWNDSVLYEVFPMSFLMEQAGGQAFTGKQRVCFQS